ncbi:MSHA biogenesis protein MshJ [Shewanella sedimentimangrovi]|uniref:MSHA biogenesis protein MshJ n=1 Tax=Shewanella sedimentimangrovi TaxID=2814293 RepID=A0ABX7R1Z5_9GAMM|nr:MSHA biogenesis protein MshJ [Shewanella sedimentimangrovi]QSX36861.1 MSHA biogenesis protein MshJ [Shewanella sedimentimangrovi]
MSAVRELAEKYNGLSRRERGLIALATLVLLAVVLMQPLDALWQQTQAMNLRLKSLVKENEISVQQLELYRQRLALDPNASYRQRLSQLAAEQQQLDARLDEQMVAMVPAKFMPGLLNRMLESMPGLKLQEFASIAPEPLLQVGETEKLNLYSHGMRMKLSGDFFSLLRFMQALESMPTKLYWKRLDYQVKDYPGAEVELLLYTLSINEDFISVAKD